jgi:hypothetical protein
MKAVFLLRWCSTTRIRRSRCENNSYRFAPSPDQPAARSRSPTTVRPGFPRSGGRVRALRAPIASGGRDRRLRGGLSKDGGGRRFRGGGRRSDDTRKVGRVPSSRDLLTQEGSFSRAVSNSDRAPDPGSDGNRHGFGCSRIADRRASSLANPTRSAGRRDPTATCVGAGSIAQHYKGRFAK